MKKAAKRTKKAATKKVAKRPAKKAAARAPRATGDGTTPVSAIMSKRVKTVDADMGLEAAMDVMVSQDIGHLPVVDRGGKLVGILSKSDLVRERFLEGDTETKDVRFPGRHGVTYSPGPGYHEDTLVRRTVADAMSRQVRTVRADDTVSAAAKEMASHRIHGLPVLGQDSAVVGIVSTFDIVGWVAAR